MFSLLYVCTAAGDPSARTHIRDQALRLFAERGPDAVSIRVIARAAGVSPALVVHHFGSKDGLRAAVDEHVAGIFDALFAADAAGDPALLSSAEAAPSLAELMLRHLPPGSPVPAYLRRVLLSGADVGHRLLGRWYLAIRPLLDSMIERGLARPSADPAVRAAFLMVNDLAVLLLRDHLTAVLGVDPLSRDGMTRWLVDVLDAYHHGVFRPREDA